MAFFGKRKKRGTTGSEGEKAPGRNPAPGEDGALTDELRAVISAAVAATSEGIIPGLSAEESVALLTAAALAWEADQVACTNLSIRPIDRSAGQIPAWGVAGNREAIESRKM